MGGTSGLTNETLFQNQNKLISSDYVLVKLTTKKNLVIYVGKFFSRHFIFPVNITAYDDVFLKKKRIILCC